MYRFTPWYLESFSFLAASYARRSSSSRSAFFWARPRNSFWPWNSVSLSSATAFAACSCSAKLTKPKPRLLPSWSVANATDVILPYFSNSFSNSSCVTAGSRFFTYTFVYCARASSILA